MLVLFPCYVPPSIRLSNLYCSSIKTGVPSPVTYGAQNQPTLKTKRYKSRKKNRIPSSDGGEPLSAASRVSARFDVREARTTVTVQPGIEETERVLAF